jgi:hypothetical protein
MLLILYAVEINNEERVILSLLQHFTVGVFHFINFGYFIITSKSQEKVLTGKQAFLYKLQYTNKGSSQTNVINWKR